MENDVNKTTFVADHPRSPISEAFRALRTNIDFASVDEPLKTILLTSPDANDGKTTLAINLAISMAQLERKVVLMDGDLRKPNIHKKLNINNQPGLTDVFRERMNIFDVIRNWKEQRVIVVTSGSIPPNPAELLGSRRMDHILENLEEVVDTVIIDGSPMVVTDAQILASKTSAVILVLRPGQTRDEEARSINEQLKRAGARLIGVIFNRIPRRSSASYGNYRHLSPYVGEQYGEIGESSPVADSAKKLAEDHASS
jgi:succinoglycan biosynthesis transport protein ExoP